MTSFESAHELSFAQLCTMIQRGEEQASNALMEIYTRTSSAVLGLAELMASSSYHQPSALKPGQALTKVYRSFWENSHQLSQWPVSSESEYEAAFYAFAHQELVSYYNQADLDTAQIPQVSSAYLTQREPARLVPWPDELAQLQQELPGAAAEAFNLSYMQGLNYYQLAEHTGSSVATVKSRLRNMVLRLVGDHPDTSQDPLQVQQHYFARDDSKPQASGQFGKNIAEDLAHGLIVPWAELMAAGALNAQERQALVLALNQVAEEQREEFVARFHAGIVALAAQVKKVQAKVPPQLREELADSLSERPPAPAPQLSPEAELAETEDAEAPEAEHKSKAFLYTGVAVILVILLIVLFTQIL